MKNYRNRPHRQLLMLLFASWMVIFQGCSGADRKELYHAFPGGTWDRYNYLSFEMPVDQTGTWDLSFFVRFEKGFAMDELPFHMVLATPAGEERTKEYIMAVRSKDGAFLAPLKGDSCEISMILKDELQISRPGTLKIVLENLNPRLSVSGVKGAGVRLQPSRK